MQAAPCGLVVGHDGELRQVVTHYFIVYLCIYIYCIFVCVLVWKVDIDLESMPILFCCDALPDTCIVRPDGIFERCIMPRPLCWRSELLPGSVKDANQMVIVSRCDMHMLLLKAQSSARVFW